MKPNEIVTLQKAYFISGKTRPAQARRNALVKLRDAILQYESALNEAMEEDLGKSPAETYLTEIGVVLDELRHAEKHLSRWMKTKRVKTPMTHMPARSMIVQEPYGVALIMSPWNYPFQLCIAPLIGAIAAGNTAVIKVSKSTPHVAHVVRDMINETFDAAYLYCTDPVGDSYDEVLDAPYDIIMFTGSARIGSVVMASAAKYLTPVVLELGGKSPCIVDETANIPLAAKRIVWGKFLNAGQTCVAPDHVIVHESVKDQLLGAMQMWIKEMYGEQPLENKTVGKIVSAEHYDRLMAYLDGETIVCGGNGNWEDRRIEPTILDGITYDSKIMQDEIFGPILPVLTYSKLNDLITDLKQRPHPLALYLFTLDKQHETQVLHNVLYGGGCVNDTVMHVASGYLPFGGIGSSGMGSYHGKKSFDTFSHAKSVLKSAARLDTNLRYPPYKEKTMKLVKKILK